MILEKYQKEQIDKEIKEKGKFNINGYFSVMIVGGRKGKINGIFGDKKRYNKRARFRVSQTFKEKYCK